MFCDSVHVCIRFCQSIVISSTSIYSCENLSCLTFKLIASSSPLTEIDIGQIEGAYVMGLGLWNSEETKFDPSSGRLLTRDTWVENKYNIDSIWT